MLQFGNSERGLKPRDYMLDPHMSLRRYVAKIIDEETTGVRPDCQESVRNRRDYGVTLLCGFTD